MQCSGQGWALVLPPTADSGASLNVKLFVVFHVSSAEELLRCEWIGDVF